MSSDPRRAPRPQQPLRQQAQPPRQPRPAGGYEAAGPQVMPGGGGSGGNGGSRVGGGGRRNGRGRGRGIAAAAGLVFLAVVATAGGVLYKTLHNVTSAGGGTVAGFLDTIRNPRGKFPQKATGERLNILLIGVDYSYLWTKKNVALNGARYTKESRSDTIMMMSLDLDSKKVSALSIPRDTWVTDPKGHRGKINGTYKRGGAKLLGQTVSELLGVSPDYYVAVKPDAVKALVNELGGVEVETIDAMEYNDSAASLHINLPKGRQTIDGDQAIGFARFREADIYERTPDGQPIYTGRKDSQGNPIFRRRHHVAHSKEEGDPRRMARQQQLIRAVAARAKSPENWLKLDRVVNTALGEVETNLLPEQMFALVALFRDLKPEQLQSGTLVGRGMMAGTYRFLPDEEKKKALVDWLLKGDETAANRLTVVAVQNATDVPGLAARVADMLREQGFDAKSTGNYEPEGEGAPGADAGASTRIVYGKAAVAPRVERIRQLLGGGQAVKEVKPDTQGAEGYTHENAADVTVILGRDLATNFTQRSARR